MKNDENNVIDELSIDIKQELLDNEYNSFQSTTEDNFDNINEERYDLENSGYNKTISKQQNDNEFDQLPKEEQNKIVLYNISSFIALVVFLLIILYIL